MIEGKNLGRITTKEKLPQKFPGGFQMFFTI